MTYLYFMKMVEDAQIKAGGQPADIRPQVSGRITQICVKEGAHVKKGQPLIILDQVPYQAAVRNAEARVSSAKAQLATVRQTLEGKEKLFQQHVIGDFDLNKARNEAAFYYFTFYQLQDLLQLPATGD